MSRSGVDLSGIYAPAIVATGPGIDPTGVADSSVAIQAKLDAARAFAVAAGSRTRIKVTLPRGVYKAALTARGQVELAGEGALLTALAGLAIITAAAEDNGRISNLALNGGGAGNGASGIVIPTGTRFWEVDTIRCTQFSSRALLLAAGSTACTVTEFFAENCLLTTAGLAAKTGVIEVAGTDHHLQGNIEITASRAGLSSVNAYACGVVVTGAANFLDDVLAEISDVGFYVSATDLTMKGCRADLNRGHGFEFANGSGTVNTCTALRNGRETDNTYDGFSVTAGNFMFTGCLANSSSGGGFTHRYGFNDAQNSDGNKNIYVGCKSFGHTTRGFNIAGFAGAAVNLLDHPRVTLLGATPNVDQITQVKLNNAGATGVTNFTNGISGQLLTLWGDGFSTITHGATIVMKGAASILLAANATLMLRHYNGAWYEV